MPPDGVLVLYTDGLVERRGEPLDRGFERLCSEVTPEDPEAVCRRVTNALIGDWPPDDDVALLALQRRPPKHSAGR
jgi:serine phosphatase RsbU (regulator of sigma subunit)